MSWPAATRSRSRAVVNGLPPGRGRHRMASAAGIAIVSVLQASQGFGQNPACQVETVPVATARTPFTLIRSVRELAHGVVLVLDYGDRALNLVDLRSGKSVAVGGHGSGPGEYLLPELLLPLDNGRTGLLDPPNSRILILASDGTPVGVVSDRAPMAGGARAGLEATRVSSSDSLGRLYSRAMSVGLGAGGTLTVTDSAAIERWVPGINRRQTVGFVPTQLPPDAVIVQGVVAAPPRGALPFAVNPQWAVALDGRVAIVHTKPYRVDFLEPDGRRVEGAPIEFVPVRVTEAHRRLWRQAQARPVFQTVHPGDGAPPTVRVAQRRAQEPPRWPNTLPAITGERPTFDRLGRLWVARNSLAGAPPRYDIIGQDGHRVAQCELPRGTRLLGFGMEGVFLARVDSDELEHLQRHVLPARLRR